jgi:hypothetical protein
LTDALTFDLSRSKPNSKKILAVEAFDRVGISVASKALGTAAQALLRNA